MKIGQAFFKINKDFALSTFEEHQFDVVFIIGIEKTTTNRVVVECNSVKSTIADIHDKNKFVLNPTELTLDVNVDDFMRMSDKGQNDLFRDSIGYYDNPEDLRAEHKTLALLDISKERLHLQQESDRLDYIENELDSGDSPFVAQLKSPIGTINVDDRVELQALFGTTDVTKNTDFFVNNNFLGAGNIFYTPNATGLYSVRGVYQSYVSEFTFEVE